MDGDEVARGIEEKAYRRMIGGVVAEKATELAQILQRINGRRKNNENSLR